jgi:hypothetical protein
MAIVVVVEVVGVVVVVDPSSTGLLAGAVVPGTTGAVTGSETTGSPVNFGAWNFDANVSAIPTSAVIAIQRRTVTRHRPISLFLSRIARPAP